MDHLQKTKRRVSLSLFALVALENAIAIILVAGLHHSTNLKLSEILFISLAVGLLIAAIISIGFASYALQPLKAVWQLILNLSPTEQGTAAPQIKNLQLGRELVTALSAQVYQMVDLSAKTAEQNKLQASDLHRNFIAQNLPLPLIVIDSKQTITFTNEVAADYIGIASEDMIGKNVYMVLDMSFPSNDTFDVWLKEVASKKATAIASWERVRLNIRDSHPVRLFDLAAYYNRDNSQGNETMLVLFDHTKMYSQDEQAISFIALSVHELRTPLTLLRGYIEVFEDELGPSLSPEQKDFMQKMHSQSQQLADYINNILNVARIDDDQLELKLQSEDWSAILKSSVEAISLRAKVRGISLKCHFDGDLPPVAVDSISIREVINNLVDNAIKYSGDSKVINIQTSLNQEGLIETTVQDFGKGMPANILSNLFTKFYRDHNNRAQIGGTGLGLYLCKAIITAHSGRIWVRSNEGKGSTFGFTLVPYAKLDENLKGNKDEGVTRSTHGWIKNHSLYRR
jgi:signal transduction histidine kinase